MQNSENKVNSSEPSFLVKHKKALIVTAVVAIVCVVTFFGIALFMIIRGFLGFQNTTTDIIDNNLDYLNELEDLQKKYRDSNPYNNQDLYEDNDNSNN